MTIQDLYKEAKQGVEDIENQIAAHDAQRQGLEELLISKQERLALIESLMPPEEPEE